MNSYAQKRMAQGRLLKIHQRLTEYLLERGGAGEVYPTPDVDERRRKTVQYIKRCPHFTPQLIILATQHDYAPELRTIASALIAYTMDKPGYADNTESAHRDESIYDAAINGWRDGVLALMHTQNPDDQLKGHSLFLASLPKHRLLLDGSTRVEPSYLEGEIMYLYPEVLSCLVTTRSVEAMELAWKALGCSGIPDDDLVRVIVDAGDRILMHPKGREEILLVQKAVEAAREITESFENELSELSRRASEQLQRIVSLEDKRRSRLHANGQGSRRPACINE